MLKVILVVDDEPDLREMLHELLNDAGYLCYAEGSVNDAIIKVNQLTTDKINIDLIISDLNMPGGSGIELLQLVQNLGLEASFLFLSGESINEEIKPYLDLGICGYQVKPFRSLDFLNRIKDILN